jgi:hypothetical protein
MDPKRILICIVVALIAITLTDFLIHEVWLKNIYAQDAGKLWRTEPNLGLIHVGHLLVAIAFAMLWTRIRFGGAGIQCAVALGVFLGLFQAGGTVITAAVQPLPEGLMTKWIIAAMAQSILVSVLLFFVYKPTKSCPDLKSN